MKSIFLNGPLDEVGYVTQPLGFMIQEEARKMYKFHKSLYGLKHAHMTWSKKISSYLVKLGFIKYRSEYDVYVHVMTHDITIILLYVNDFLVTRNSMKNSSKFKELMKMEFEMSDLENLSYFIGVEFQITEQGMILYQRKYVTEILMIFRMDDSNPASSPFKPNMKLEKHEEEDKIDVTLFKQIVGSMRYVCDNIPDIGFSVKLVRRYMDERKVSHMKVVRRILRYRKRLVNRGILFPRDSDSKEDVINYYSGANWCRDSKSKDTMK